MSEVEKNEEIEFNVEDGVVDSEELRAEDYRKYRELYKLLAKIKICSSVDDFCYCSDLICRGSVHQMVRDLGWGFYNAFCLLYHWCIIWYCFDSSNNNLR